MTLPRPDQIAGLFPRPSSTKREPTPLSQAGPLSTLFGAVGQHTLYFSKSIPAATSDSEIQRLPDGYKFVDSVKIYFPAGPSGLVGVRITSELKGAVTYIVPTRPELFVALDDVIYTAENLRFEVEGNIRVEWQNADGAFAHTVPVSVTVER